MNLKEAVIVVVAVISITGLSAGAMAAMSSTGGARLAKAADICKQHVDPSVEIAVMPPRPIYRQEWQELCEAIDGKIAEKKRIEQTKDHSREDANDREYLKRVLGDPE